MPPQPASNRDVKRRNRTSILRALLAREDVSQAELAQTLGLSLPTVLQNVRDFMELGLVREVGTYQSTGGRRARAYAPVRDARLALGIGITQRHVGLVLVDLAGSVVSYERRRLPFSPSDAYARALAEALASFVPPEARERVLGAGVSLPGILNADGSTLLVSHALDVRDLPTADLVTHVPHPCLFINDANAAGAAEVWGGEHAGSLVYLSLSETVGGAIFHDGALYRGENLRAGEFGHMTLVPHGERCYCGKDGCLDAYCSARVLSGRAGGSLEEFFRRLEAGDAEAARAWETYLDHLALAINNLRMCFDGAVIAGGDVGAHLERHGSGLAARLARLNTFGDDASYVRPCTHRTEASAVGAALMQVEAFLQTV